MKILKRLILVVCAVPYLVLFVPLTIVSPITWALTGKNWDQQAESLCRLRRSRDRMGVQQMRIVGIALWHFMVGAFLALAVLALWKALFRR